MILYWSSGFLVNNFFYFVSFAIFTTAAFTLCLYNSRVFGKLCNAQGCKKMTITVNTVIMGVYSHFRPSP